MLGFTKSNVVFLSSLLLGKVALYIPGLFCQPSRQPFLDLRKAISPLGSFVVLSHKDTSIDSVLGRKRLKEERAEEYTPSALILQGLHGALPSPV